MYQVGIIGNGISAKIAALAAASAQCHVTLFEVGSESAKLAHAHLLLAGSWQALLELAPDIAFDINSLAFADTTRDWRFHSAVGKITTMPCHVSTPVISAGHLRTILTAAVRRRPNIEIQAITDTDIAELLKKPGDSSYFLATGMMTPLTTTILRGITGHTLDINKEARHSVYSSFNFQFGPDDEPCWRVKIRDLRCDGQHGLLAQIFDNGSALVSAVSGGPVRTIPELTRFLCGIGESAFGETLRYANMTAPIQWYRSPGTIRRLTSILGGWHPNICLFGDAALATDPYFGHGTFLAAVQGLALKQALTFDRSVSLRQKLDIFRTKQDHLLSKCLDLQAKLRSPHIVSKFSIMTRLKTLSSLHLSIGLRRKFIRKIHMIEFLENIKLSWRSQNEEESSVSHLSGDEITFSAMERLISHDQSRPIARQKRRSVAVDR